MGHPEGWNDAFRGNIAAFYSYIAEGKKPGIDKPDFATLEEAAYIVRLTEAIVKSANTRSWVTL
jgi:predicted dehydrogenase